MASVRVHNDDHCYATNHTDANRAFFAVIKAVVVSFKGEAIENLNGIRKTYAMLGNVLAILDFIPLKQIL